MRVVIQRVKSASVTIRKEIFSQIKEGLLVLVGIEDSDTEEDISYLCHKIINLRIFDDDNKIMNLAIKDINGEIMCVSQFTLYASTKKGNRPSYIRASKPLIANTMYNLFCNKIELCMERPVKRGIFGEDMQINLLNNSPVTICIDSKNKE